MAETTVEAFKAALHQYPSSAELTHSFGRFQEWYYQFEDSPSDTGRPSLRDRLSELPGARQQLFSAFGTILFLLEQIYYSCQRADLTVLDDDQCGLAPFEQAQIDSDIAHVRQSVQSLYTISSIADEIEAENVYIDALRSDIHPVNTSYDIVYVTDKYSASRADDWLLQRLGTAISHRRSYLRSCAFEAEHKQHARAAMAMFSDGLDDFRSLQCSDAGSNVDEDTAKIIPSLEDVKASDALVDCLCCQKIFYFNSENACRTHFLSDLRPYVCKSRDCSVGMFASKTAWIDHEMDYHQRQWKFSLCSTICNSLDDYEDHIYDIHVDIEDKVKIEILTEVESQPRETIARAECPLCDWTKSELPTRAMLDHLATHFENLAVYANTTRHELPEGRKDIAIQGKELTASKTPALVATFLTSAFAAGLSSSLTLFAFRRGLADTSANDVAVSQDKQSELLLMSDHQSQLVNHNRPDLPLHIGLSDDIATHCGTNAVQLSNPINQVEAEQEVLNRLEFQQQLATVPQNEPGKSDLDTRWQSALETMWQSATTESRQLCPEDRCTVGFRRLSDLERHRRSVHRQAPNSGNPVIYRCGVAGCDVERSRRHHFQRHVKRFHPDRNVEVLIRESTVPVLKLPQPDLIEIEHNTPSSLTHSTVQAAKKLSLSKVAGSGNVSFFFQIRGMAPDPWLDDHTDPRDRWLPPKKKGSNSLHIIPGQNTTVNFTFYYNGETTSLLNAQQVAALHTRVVPYETYSMYHARGFFWTVDYDATRTKVGDGKHAEDSDTEDITDSDTSDDDNEEHDDWSELSYDRAEVEGLQSLSYVGRHGRKGRLLAQRRDQTWAHHLLPDGYQSRIITSDRRAGGLAGELPLLIALVAMSLPTTAWTTMIPQTLATAARKAGVWGFSPQQLNEVERGSQWFEKRGEVVAVFRDSEGSSAEDLKNFENGVFGPIFA